MSLWDSVRYGFSPVYWVQIAGIPVVFIERASGLALPAGYTSEDASLVIDASAEVGVEQIDRDTGAAVSLSFGFKLLDTATVRDWLRRWSKSMTLASDLTATATTMTVASTSGWANGDAVYAGMERLTIGTVASGVSCTGLTRATVGTLAYAHQTGTTAQILTDRLRFWRGRDVTLWASPCDPAGFITGTSLLADAVQVWRGRIETGPAREVDGFTFQANSIDRLMDRTLIASVTGQVVSTSAKIPVSKGYLVTIALRANTGAGVQVFAYTFHCAPFEDLADGDLLTMAEIRDRIVSSFSDAVSAESATADVGALVWLKYGMKHGPTYNAKVIVKADATIKNFEVYVLLDNKTITAQLDLHPNGWAVEGYADLHWATASNPLAPGAAGEPVIPWLVTVRVDDGSPSDVPQGGRLKLRLGNTTRLFKYEAATPSSADVYLTGLTPVDGIQSWPSKLAMDGADAEIFFGDEGTFPNMMLRCLMSSGNGERSATYDTLKRGQGYGIDEDLIDATSFTTTSAPIGTLKGEAASGGESFSTLFGGALGLFRRAVVSRPDPDAANDALKLRMVETAPYGAGGKTTITDADLLSGQDDPVISVKRAASANVLAILRPYGGQDDGEDRFVFADNPRVDAEGRNQVEYRIAAKERVALYKAAGPAAASHLAADQTTQALELRIPPWIVAEVGDVITLDTTHPALWTWSASPASTGYTGKARVVGRTLELKSSAVRLTLLVDASVSVTSLSPAALVVNFVAPAADPDSIDVHVKYADHFIDAIAAAGGPVWVLHYQPGQAETAAQKHQISAAVKVAGICRLTVDTTSGGHSLSTGLKSTLTLPTLAAGDITAYQADFAHTDDGTAWG